jgi:hypothetical protein
MDFDIGGNIESVRTAKESVSLDSWTPDNPEEFFSVSPPFSYASLS